MIYTLTTFNIFISTIEPPSVPQNIEIISVTATTIHLSWSPPQYNGSRSDLYYTVQYSDPDNVGQSIMATDTMCMSQTCFTITGLQPFTTYLIIVTAHNGVSDQDKPGLQGRMAEIRVTTNSSCKLNFTQSAICMYLIIIYYSRFISLLKNSFQIL